MTTGAIGAARSLRKRRRWEQANTQAAILLDWDDVQAVATRAPQITDVADLLARYKENGATHLSLPELSLNRLVGCGQVSVTQGQSTRRVYLQVQSAALADLLAAEMRARLPQIGTRRSKGNIISFEGDFASVAEVGLGFDPAQAGLAQQTGLSPVARPVGFSWVQPAMIDRTFDQVMALGCKIVAVQGTLIPGHEFNIQHTVAAMRRNGLTYAYFRESRHQKGDWFLAKQLAPSGQVILAHELTPSELLDEDLHSAAYRWGNLATEAGVRFCSVRFFRILHAADPLESIDYVREINHAVQHAGLSLMGGTPPNLSSVQSVPDKTSLAWVGVSTAGAVGLATDLLSLPDWLKLLKAVGAAALLGGLPLVKFPQRSHDHHHDHHDHHDDHSNGHDHHHHHGPAPAPTAYVQKGLSLAATLAYPAATAAITGPDPACILSQAALVSAAGAATVSATTVDADYLLGIEEYRGYNLDWLVPLGLVAASAVLAPKSKPGWWHNFVRRFPLINSQNAPGYRLPTGLSRIIPRADHPGGKRQVSSAIWRWLPAMGVTAAAIAAITGKLPGDLPGWLDREHRHSHTHHLSQFQAKLGDAKMALSPRPLRKWPFWAPLGLVGASMLRQSGRPELAPLAQWMAVEGQVSWLTGFRQGQRPLVKTTPPRVKNWLAGAMMAAAAWAVFWLVKRK